MTWTPLCLIFQGHWYSEEYARIRRGFLLFECDGDEPTNEVRPLVEARRGS